jgi:predicted ATP-grasp superfamily ATP-dependent carboligase
LTAEAVLIAAFSARALAASARRAGFLPLAVDCFGDLDTSEHAVASRCLPARVQTGFIAKSLFAALEALVDEAPRPPIGLVLGSGFECNPRLVSRLGERYRLIGNSPAVIERTKSPDTFFSTLDRLGIPHPETRLAPPPETGGWLMKRIGGSGGLHIVDCPAKPRPDPRRYFQRRADGAAISVMGIISKQGSAFAMSRQWTSPLPKRPYRYGGAAGSLELGADLEARLIDTSLALSRELGLVGLVSFDFLVADGQATLLEVNPRPGATLDVFDDASGSLFRAHVEASLGGDAASLLKSGWRPPAARAAAFLYADRGPIKVPVIDWPPWTADRPRPGSLISQHQPAATVVAEDTELALAERTCRNRLGLLEDMLYEGENAKGAPQ